MKIGLKKMLGILAIALGLSSIGMASVADAGYVCRVQGGFWRHGHWHPAHRVCWHTGYYPVVYRHCGWVDGHWYYGRWIPGHRNCW